MCYWQRGISTIDAARSDETIDTYLKQIQNVDCHMMLLFCKSATFVRLTNIEKYLYCDLFIQCEDTV